MLQTAVQGLLRHVFQCPACGRHGARRSQRTGFLENVVSLVYCYPFRCVECHHRFTAFSARRWEKRRQG
jgi:hypothetical protein